MHSRAKRRLEPFLFVFLVIFTWQFSAMAQAQSQTPPGAGANPALRQETTVATTATDLSKKNVLILHTFAYDTSAYLVMDPIFLKGFTDAGFDASNLHFEFLDLLKHRDQAYRRETAEYLRRKFTDQPIDLIIALHRTALSYLLEDGKRLFPGVPAINVIADPDWLREDFRTANEHQLQELKRSSIIMPLATGTEPTIKNLLTLLPETRTLVVISGSDLLDRLTEQSVRGTLEAWHGRLRIEYLSGPPLEEVIERVSALPPKTAILYTVFGADTKGRTYRNYDVLRKISRAANAPIFGLYDTLLGNGGIVGGTMPSYSVEAARTVRLSLEILRGRLPTEPVTILPAHFIPMFDWEQLKRWGINENRLPPGSNVLNRPKTIWSEYKGLVIGGVAIILMQAVLVIGLLMQKRKKEVAETSLRQRTEELDQFFNVNLDLLCVANADGYFLRLNPAVERILGYTREELMAKKFFEFIHPDDLEKTRGAMSALSSQQRIFSFENRYRCKDGTYRWLEWSSAPVGKLIYAAARDVTERRQYEQTLQENERVLRQNENDLRRLAGRLISAQEEERSHLARELHDDMAQRLAVLSIDAGKLEQELRDSPGSIKEKLSEMKNQTVKISGDVHNLARQLHPSILDDLGLVRAIESECAAFLKREGVDIIFNHDQIPNTMEKDVSLALYRIVQEGLRNISKHACANHVSVSLKGVDQNVLLSIQDDGIGFDLVEARVLPGLGLSSLHERVRLINGELSIQSQPGKGTVITVKAPMGNSRQG